MRRLGSVVAGIVLIVGMTSLTQAQPPGNSITNTTTANKYPAPWNSTLSPQGKYSIANGVTKSQIEVEIGTYKNGVFTPDPNVPLQYGTGVNGSWSSAAYTNLVSGQWYSTRATLKVAYGNPPGALAVVATDIRTQQVP